MIKLPEKLGYTIIELDALRKKFMSARMRLERQWKVLDSYDCGEFWETLRKKLPKHQIIPDTNYIFYVKDNIVNSVYAAPFLADVMPIDPSDLEGTRQLNKFLEFEFNKNEIGYKQLEIGTRAALLNVGFLQGGWDSSVTLTVNDNKMKGEMTYTVRDPMSTLLDPNFVDFQLGRAVFINSEDSYENLVARYPKAKEELDEKYKKKTKDKNKAIIVSTASGQEIGRSYIETGMQPMSEGMIAVFIAFKKIPLDKGSFRIDQIIYTKEGVILEFKKGIKPNYFPLVPLYGQPPLKDAYGIGVCQRVLKNVLSINILDSIAITHTYAAQRTPVILNESSGLTARRVQQDLNNPDRIFSINEGDIKNVLERLDYPDLPSNLEFIKRGLIESVFMVSGVDEKYTGRDTGSIITTGGMERMQARMSMTDNTRIQNIERYARSLTKMILDFYSIHGGKRTFSTDPNYGDKIEEAMTIDFSQYSTDSDIKPRQFSLRIDASPQLPKNRARLAEAANIIMQVQMQYQQGGQEVKLITPEEWLFFQDFPQKDMMLDRMKIERMQSDHENITNELSGFASMTENGMRPEEAVNQLAEERAVGREPGVRNKTLQNMK